MSRAKPDRRIARTQQSLHRSLNTLILEKGYEATTIKDIVSRANVGRSTFYAHHGSKEGLLLSGFQHLHAALLTQQNETLAASVGANAPMLAFSRVFFEHVHEYRDVFLALIKNPTGPTVTRKIKRMLADVVRQDLRNTKPEKCTDKVPRDAVVQFTVDALFSILLWWLEHNPKLSPAEADAIFRRLALPGLAAVGSI
ncbi:MAG TPA: TetR/AcrR family transcriptional regulator [Opitutaceae bacterium]|nr:TetR/AcrR family transcriptional regulator [Lacunisphaera sp.]HWA09127.1 TetR/AcrR family transcriptional regulator [Opitutaceae bacterium]